MSGAWGVTQAGFVVKPLANIVSDMQTQIWSTVSPTLDLSPQTPDGQFVGIYSAAAASLWELLAVIYSQLNRQDAEGQALDNIGDISGNPRETISYTQVLCNLTISAANAPYAAGSLVAYVQGNPNFTFQNLGAVTASMIVGGIATGVVMQAQTIGPTAAVNDGTLNQIATQVIGWTAINNPGPGSQTQAGTNAELDQAYTVRQVLELPNQGASNPGATAAAIVALGAAQNPPVTLQVSVLNNPTNAAITTSGITLPPHTFLPVVYDGGTGWLAIAANAQLVANTIYANKPTGIQTANVPGATAYTVVDPVLGNQTVYFVQPTAVPVYTYFIGVLRSGFALATVQTGVGTALAVAATAPTPANGTPPAGQQTPGTTVIPSQLAAVGLEVAGMFDIQSTMVTTSAPGAIAGTMGVTNGSATISLSAVLVAGSLITFASQPGIWYQLATGTVGGSATLTTPYTGTTNAATSATGQVPAPPTTPIVMTALQVGTFSPSNVAVILGIAP